MNFWFEKYLKENIVVYFGTLYNFRIGIILGVDNEIYLGWIILGMSFNG